MKQKKENIGIRIVSIIGTIVIVGVIFLGDNEVFFTVGAIGGCVFLIKLFLEGTFPNLFKDDYKQRK